LPCHAQRNRAVRIYLDYGPFIGNIDTGITVILEACEKRFHLVASLIIQVRIVIDTVEVYRSGPDRTLGYSDVASALAEISSGHGKRISI
jgi:hypothetical protein